jgi:hypothetical protein
MSLNSPVTFQWIQPIESNTPWVDAPMQPQMRIFWQKKVHNTMAALQPLSLYPIAESVVLDLLAGLKAYINPCLLQYSLAATRIGRLSRTGFSCCLQKVLQLRGIAESHQRVLLLLLLLLLLTCYGGGGREKKAIPPTHMTWYVLIRSVCLCCLKHNPTSPTTTSTHSIRNRIIPTLGHGNSHLHPSLFPNFEDSPAFNSLVLRASGKDILAPYASMYNWVAGALSFNFCKIWDSQDS